MTTISEFGHPEMQQDNSHDMHNLEVLRTISVSKFPVYLAYSHRYQEHYALKTYSYESKDINASFLRESRLASVKHPNVINILYSQALQRAVSDGKTSNVSYILMEYAPFGDLTDMITKGCLSDEKIVRTYFHQLVNGLEFLHSKGIYHMDLKTDNLLVGKDYKLKISDFDASYFQGDEFMAGRGTRNFRSPEVLAEKCELPEKIGRAHV